MWNLQCCYSLLPGMGFSEESMFRYRKSTYRILTEHCTYRYKMVVDPRERIGQWLIDDLVRQGATRILFSNGENDIWSHGGITERLADSLVAIVMPNGGHHSEDYVRPDGTPDILEAQVQIAALVSQCLDDIQKGELGHSQLK